MIMLFERPMPCCMYVCGCSHSSGPYLYKCLVHWNENKLLAVHVTFSWEFTDFHWTLHIVVEALLWVHGLCILWVLAVGLHVLVFVYCVFVCVSVCLSAGQSDGNLTSVQWILFTRSAASPHNSHNTKHTLLLHCYCVHGYVVSKENRISFYFPSCVGPQFEALVQHDITGQPFRLGNGHIKLTSTSQMSILIYLIWMYWPEVICQ